MNVARLSPDGKLIAASKDNILYIYDAADPSREITRGEYHKGMINDIDWSHSGMHIATAAQDGFVVVWRLYMDTRISSNWLVEPCRAMQGREGPSVCLKWNPRGTMVAAGYLNGRVILWNIMGGALWRKINIHNRTVTAVDFSYDSKLLLTASYDGFVRVWNMQDGMCLLTLRGPWYEMDGHNDDMPHRKPMPVSGARFSFTARMAAIYFMDGAAILFDLVAKEPLKRYAPAELYVAEDRRQRDIQFIKPDKLALATTTGIKIYNVDTMEVVQQLGDKPVLTASVGSELAISAGPNALEVHKLH